MTDQNFKTSFIPAKPIQPISKGGGLGVSSGNFLNIITLIIFLVAIAASGATYGYKIWLQSVDRQGIKDLEDAKQTFNIPLVNQADRLNNRMKNVQSLLNEHLSPSKLFEELEDKTLNTIQFNNLTFTKESDGTFKLNASGIASKYGDASGYEAIILQSKAYSSFLKDVLFTVQTTQLGDISFVLNAAIDKDRILYKNQISDTETNQESDSSASKGDSFENPGQENNN